MPSTVSTLGLGRMGATLAEAFIRAGHEVTVWNRSEQPRSAFRGRASIADTAADACRASSLIVSCLADYETTRAMLDQPGVASALAGRVLVQLASGGPDDARSLGGWAAANAVAYLDGAIITYPARIGAPETLIVYSGSRRAFDAERGTLDALGGKTTFVSDGVGGAAAFDQAWLSFLYGSAAGLLQGAAFVESENVNPSVLFQAVPSFLVEVAAEARYYEDLIRRGDYHGDQATLSVHAAAMEHLVAAARANGVNDAFPAVLHDLFRAAVRDGHGDEEIAAAIDVFRRHGW